MAIIGVKVARVTNLTSWPLGREAAEIAEVLSIKHKTLRTITYTIPICNVYRGCDVLMVFRLTGPYSSHSQAHGNIWKWFM